MKKTATTQPNFGNMLDTYIRKNRLRQAALARNLGVGIASLIRYMRQPDIRLSAIWNLSNTLQYNFLSDLASQLPADLPCAPTPKDQRIAQLEQQLHELTTECSGLQREVKVLKGTIAAAMSGNASAT